MFLSTFHYAFCMKRRGLLSKFLFPYEFYAQGVLDDKQKQLKYEQNKRYYWKHREKERARRKERYELTGQ